MFRSIAKAYGESSRFVVALPLIAAIPIAAELFQHLVEYSIGMYQSYASAEKTANHPARMWSGHLKVFTLAIIVYWVSRYLTWHDARRAWKLEPRAVLLFGRVLILNIGVSALILAGGYALGKIPEAALRLAIGGPLLLAIMFFELYFTPWKIASALGDKSMTLRASFKIMHGNLWWSFGFLLAMMLPLMILHYALGIGAIGRSDTVIWLMLASDAFVAAYLGIVLAATNVIIAKRATDKLGD